MILATSKNLLEEKKSLDLLLLVKLLEAELHIVVISGVVLGRREQPLLCEGADHCCRAWPGYLPSRFRQPPAPRTCSACTGPVLSLYKSLLKALCSCDTGTKLTELMWAEQSSSSVCAPVGLELPVQLGWSVFLAGSACRHHRDRTPLCCTLLSCSEFEACSCIMFACNSFSLMHCFCISLCVPIYIYAYIKICRWVYKQYLYLHTNLFITQYYQYTKYYAI